MRTRRRFGRAVLGLAALALLTWGAGRARADIINGGFETGDFTGWTRAAFNPPNGPFPPASANNHNAQTYISFQNAGPAATDTNAVIMTQTAPFFQQTNSGGPAIGPTQGKFFAFLSTETSAGDMTLVGSSISQTFTVPASAKSLSFDVRFLTTETAQFPDDDFGGVALLRGSTILDQFNLDNDPASPADAHTAAVAAGGFRASTPWLSESFSLAGLDGQSLTLLAYTTNTSDNEIESRLLLDNVQITATPAGTIPEPSTLALFALGGLALAGWRWRMRRGTRQHAV
jgi:hypothetical protein